MFEKNRPLEMPVYEGKPATPPEKREDRFSKKSESDPEILGELPFGAEIMPPYQWEAYKKQNGIFSEREPYPESVENDLQRRFGSAYPKRGERILGRECIFCDKENVFLRDSVRSVAKVSLEYVMKLATDKKPEQLSDEPAEYQKAS